MVPTAVVRVRRLTENSHYVDPKLGEVFNFGVIYFKVFNFTLYIYLPNIFCYSNYVHCYI